MVQDVTKILSGGVSTNIGEIEKDAYLIIVAGEQKDELEVFPYSKLNANSSANLLNTALKQNIANVVMAGVSSPIAQNFASKHLPNALLGRLNSSIYDIMADGEIHCEEVAEDFIGSCTNQLDNVATDMGFPTPSALYNALKPSTATGVISKDVVKFVSSFSKASKKENEDKENDINNAEKNVIVVKLKLVQEDTENLGIEIPSRKTENNFNIATAINNQNLERTFEAKIVHNDRKSVNMIDVKNRLKVIRDMKDHVNVYICDEDIKELEIIENCLLSSLSFGVEHKNSLNCSIGFTKVPQWEVKLDATMNKSLSNNATSGSNRTTTENSNAKNKNQKVEMPKQFVLGNQSGYDRAKYAVEKYNEYAQSGDTGQMDYYKKEIYNALSDNKANQGFGWTPELIDKALNSGAKVVKAK